MCKVQILGPKGLLDEAIKALHAMAVVHIETSRSGSELDGTFFKRVPLEGDKVRERERLVKVKEELGNLRILLKSPYSAVAESVDIDRLEDFLITIKPVEERAKILHGEKTGYMDELSSIERYGSVLRGFASMVSRLGGLKSFDIIGLTIDKAQGSVLKLLEQEIGDITCGKFEIYKKDLDEHTVAVVFAYPATFTASVRSLISGESISEITLPDNYGELPLMEVIKRMAERREALPALIESAEREISAISTIWYARIEAFIDSIDDKIEQIGVLGYCSQTRYAFVIEGWAPSETLASLTENFGKLFGEKVIIRELEIKEEETDLIPVYVENPRLIKPFEIFLKALPTPRYGSVDPTPFVALFFPTFFGLIVGDVGYGLVILLLGLFLKKKLRDKEFFRDAAYVGTLCGVSAIIFGIVFGELFGDLGEHLGIMHPLIFDRAKAIKPFMLMTIGIGVGHIILGFLIGMGNHLSRGKRKKAAGELAYILLIISMLFTIGVAGKFLPEGLLKPGLIVMAVSMALLILVEGFLAPLEFIKTIVNIVSYLRIMAVGMASVIMGVVANQIGGLVGSLVLGIVVAGLLHTLNIALAILSPSIQSMRLHYVEFFSKFYEGGGREYRPFKKR